MAYLDFLLWTTLFLYIIRWQHIHTYTPNQGHFRSLSAIQFSTDKPHFRLLLLYSLMVSFLRELSSGVSAALTLAMWILLRSSLCNVCSIVSEALVVSLCCLSRSRLCNVCQLFQRLLWFLYVVCHVHACATSAQFLQRLL